MAQITNITKLINGTLGDVTPLNNNFNEIKTKYNEHDIATSGVHNLGTNSIASKTNFQNMIDKFLPISSIMYIWRPSDVTGLPALDNSIWKQLNGTEINDEDSLFNTVTLPAMDGKYLAGVEEGRTVDATPVGNLNNVIDISHYHTATAHQHSSCSHSHDFENHRHPISGYFKFVIQEYLSYSSYCLIQPDETDIISAYYPWIATRYYSTSSLSGLDTGSEECPNLAGYTNFSSGTTMLENPANTNSSSQDTSTSGSTTFSIQPKSLKVQMYIRYK